MFIELTNTDGGEKALINILKTLHFKPNKFDGTTAQNENGSIDVKESYEQVKELIKLEVLAERGY